MVDEADAPHCLAGIHQRVKRLRVVEQTWLGRTTPKRHQSAVPVVCRGADVAGLIPTPGVGQCLQCERVANRGTTVPWGGAPPMLSGDAIYARELHNVALGHTIPVGLRVGLSRAGYLAREGTSP